MVFVGKLRTYYIATRVLSASRGDALNLNILVKILDANGKLWLAEVYHLGSNDDRRRHQDGEIGDGLMGTMIGNDGNGDGMMIRQWG
jgi:hypothetical protein